MTTGPALYAAMDAARWADLFAKELRRNIHGHSTREEVESAWSRLEAAMQDWRRGT